MYDSGNFPSTPPTPPLTLHFAQSERLLLTLGQGRGQSPSQELGPE